MPDKRKVKPPSGALRQDVLAVTPAILHLSGKTSVAKIPIIMLI
jgi:hypothetical protein